MHQSLSLRMHSYLNAFDLVETTQTVKKMSNEENSQNMNLQMQHIQMQQQQVQQQMMAEQAFWNSQIQDIKSIDASTFDFRTHQLPLARIKKIMKTDEDVRVLCICTKNFINWM